MQKILVVAIFWSSILISFTKSISDKSFSKSQSIYQSFTKLTATLKFKESAEVSVEKEHQQYTRSFTQKIYSPDLNTQIKLNGQKMYDSIFLLVEQDTTLTLEIIVGKEFNKETQIQIASKPIFCYVINRQTWEVVQSYQIHKHRIITIDSKYDRLFEVKVGIQPQQNGLYQKKTVTIHAAVDLNKKIQSNNDWLAQYKIKIGSLYDRSVQVFLDSLQKWTVIQLSSQKYIDHQNTWKRYAAFEMIAFLLVSILELVYMRRLLHSNITIV